MNKITFKSAWNILEKKLPFPKKARKVKIIDYKEFKEKVLEESPDFVEEITSSLFAGDFYFLKGAFKKEFMENLKVKTFLHYKSFFRIGDFYFVLESCEPPPVGLI